MDSSNTLEDVMKKLLSFVLLATILAIPAVLQGTFINGSITNWRWTESGSPYLIQNDITIPQGNTLLIEPGTHIYFEENTSLTVNGTLLAQGAERSHIYISSVSTWKGISFVDGADDSILEYIQIERVESGVAISIDNTHHLSITNCLFILSYENYISSDVYSSVIYANSSSYITFEHNTVSGYQMSVTTHIPIDIYMFQFQYCGYLSFKDNNITENQIDCVAFLGRDISIFSYYGCHTIAFEGNNITDNTVNCSLNVIEHMSILSFKNCNKIVFEDNTVVANQVNQALVLNGEYKNYLIYFYDSVNMSFNDNIITDNRAAIIVDFLIEYNGSSNDNTDTEIKRNQLRRNIGDSHICEVVNYRINNSFVIEDNVAMHNSIIDENGDSCIFLCGRDIVFTNNTISENQSGEVGGGLQILAQEGTISIENNIISSNSAGDGGGVYIMSDDIEAQVYFAENKIYNNTAIFGGGLTVYKSPIRADNNYLSLDLGVFIYKNTIVSNFARYGAGVSTYNSNIALVNNVIAHNHAVTGFSGYGIDIARDVENGYENLNESRTTVLVNNMIWGNDNNQINGNGIGINDILYIRNTTIEDGMSSVLYNSTIDALAVYTSDPQFIDPHTHNWHILNEDYDILSPGIGNPYPDFVGLFPFDSIYERSTHERSFSTGWQWISFPKLERDFDNNGSVAFDDVTITFGSNANTWKSQNGQSEYYSYLPGWDPTLDDIQSTMGFKIEVSNGFTHSIPGTTLNPNTEITLYPGIENWIGYFLPETQSFFSAIDAETLEKILDIHTKNGGFHYRYDAPPRPLTRYGYSVYYEPESDFISIPSITRLKFGDMVAITLKPGETEHTFTWVRGEVSPSFVREPTTFFTYNEYADYQSLFIEFEAVKNPVEIGAFINGVCKGATMYQGSMSEILLYLDDTDFNEEIEIVFAYQKIGGAYYTETMFRYSLLDTKSGQFVKTPLISSANARYYHIVFPDGKNETSEEVTPPFVQLMQNYPNPFNPDTKIDFYLSHDDHVTLSVYNIKGQKVCDLVRTTTSAGKHSVVWNGKDSMGRSVSSGIYLYKLTTGLGSVQRKMVLLK